MAGDRFTDPSRMEIQQIEDEVIRVLSRQVAARPNPVPSNAWAVSISANWPAQTLRNRLWSFAQHRLQSAVTTTRGLT